MTPRQTFRARTTQPEILLLPGVANALSALIAADLGYEALYVTGAGVSNMNLGVPDIGLLSLEDMVSAVSRIRGVCELPLVVDADTGFGSAVNVHHTVRRLEAAGANAIQLEDQVFPKKCGHFDGKAVVPTAEMVDKLRAAVDARRDPDTLIVARTDARATEGFDAAIDRAAAYADAGADVLFVEALTSHSEMQRAPALLRKPLLMNIVFGGKTPPLSGAQLQSLGYRFALYANAALQSAVWGMQTVLGELKRSGSLDGVQQYLASFAERQRLVQKADFDALEKRYARGGKTS
jgi:2-methylisocitrate lyase-like PEP mutase family enzyme